MLRSLLNFLAKPVPKRSRQMSEIARRKREFFWLCSVSLLLQKEEKGGNSASLLPLPSLLPPAISPLFNCLYIFSVSFFSSRHYGGSTAKMQGGGKTWENEERALPFSLAIIQKKLSFPSFFPSISPLFDGQLRLLCTRNKKKTKFPLRVYTRLLPRLPSGDFHERMIMTIATRDRGRNFSSSNQVFFLPIQLLFLFPFVSALFLLPCGKKRTEIRRFETDFENCSIFFLDIRPMFELQIWKRSIRDPGGLQNQTPPLRFLFPVFRQRLLL